MEKSKQNRNLLTFAKVIRDCWYFFITLLDSILASFLVIERLPSGGARQRSLVMLFNPGALPRFFLVLPALLFIAGCVNPDGSPMTLGTGGTSDVFYGIPRGAPPHAFIIDISGSMGSGVGDSAHANIARQFVNSAQRSTGQLRTGVSAVDSVLSGLQADMFSSARAQTTKLAEARRQLIPFIRGMPEGQGFSVTAFNSRFQRFGAGGVPATATSRAGAINFVNSFSASGGTRMGQPLEVAFSERPSTIYLVSDGRPSESTSQMLAMAQRARASGIVIHTIGVGEDQNRDLLGQMALITGGTYSPQATTLLPANLMQGLLP